MNLKDMRAQMRGQIERLKAEIHDAQLVKTQADQKIEEARRQLMNSFGALETLDMIDRQFTVAPKGARE